MKIETCLEVFPQTKQIEEAFKAVEIARNNFSRALAELRYALNESPLFVLSAEGKKAILNPLSSPEEEDRRVEVDLDAVINNLLRQGLEVVNNR